MPKHTLAFFDVTDIDRAEIEKHFADTSDVELILIPEPVSASNIDQAAAADVVSMFVSSNLTKTMLDHLPNLKTIACRSTGFNNIDQAEAHRRGIVITNVPSYGEHTVAEYTFLLLLAVCRRLTPSLEQARNNHIKHELLVGLDLCGKTLGVVGTGKIGRHVAQIAKGFEMNVLAYDVYPNDDAAAQLGYKYVSFDNLLAQSDFISLHAPFLPENHYLMNANSFAKAKPGAVLVNTARGELVDTAALVDALKSGHLAGAGLDVLEGEIDRRDAKLKQSIAELQQLPNLILTPHNAFNTVEANQRILTTALENISNFLQGQATNKVQYAS